MVLPGDINRMRIAVIVAGALAWAVVVGAAVTVQRALGQPARDQRCEYYAMSYGQVASMLDGIAGRVTAGTAGTQDAAQLRAFARCLRLQQRQ